MLALTYRYDVICTVSSNWNGTSLPFLKFAGLLMLFSLCHSPILMWIYLLPVNPFPKIQKQCWCLPSSENVVHLILLGFSCQPHISPRVYFFPWHSSRQCILSLFIHIFLTYIILLFCHTAFSPGILALKVSEPHTTFATKANSPDMVS